MSVKNDKKMLWKDDFNDLKQTEETILKGDELPEDLKKQYKENCLNEISDVALARDLAATMSGNCIECPQLKQLLFRLAARIEELED